ncbi:hypothetical protein [Streptomyces violarus]|uniref:hypothetical protein n=1 Tax=Streptomyces violarus TaxID=67380 RepID=UPI0021C03E0B|nr:hypothetical protein [Streptomyces violarus]MCT9139128.1 hypothetical protein [Streptomyces violarus]
MAAALRMARRPATVTVATVAMAAPEASAANGPPATGELDESEVHPDLEMLPDNVQLVLVAYTCSMEAGVMRIEWGSAESRREDRYLIWHRHEPLPPRA